MRISILRVHYFAVHFELIKLRSINSTSNSTKHNMVTHTEIEVETVHPDHDDEFTEEQVHNGRGDPLPTSDQTEEGTGPSAFSEDIGHEEGDSGNEEDQGLYPQGEPTSSSQTSSYSFNQQEDGPSEVNEPIDLQEAYRALDRQDEGRRAQTPGSGLRHGIHFDDVTPSWYRRRSGRQVDPLIAANTNARRMSLETFQSPIPTPPSVSRARGFEFDMRSDPFGHLARDPVAYSVRLPIRGARGYDTPRPNQGNDINISDPTPNPNRVSNEDAPEEAAKPMSTSMEPEANVSWWDKAKSSIKMGIPDSTIRGSSKKASVTSKKSSSSGNQTSTSTSTSNPTSTSKSRLKPPPMKATAPSGSGNGGGPGPCPRCGGPHVLADCPANVRPAPGIVCQLCGGNHPTLRCPQYRRPTPPQSGHAPQPVPAPAPAPAPTPPHQPRPGPVCMICGGPHASANCPHIGLQNSARACIHCGSTAHASDQCPTLINNRRQNQVQVNGRNLTIRNQPTDIHTFAPRKVWNKYTRWQLTADERIAFDKAASGYVLSKGNKFKIHSRLDKDDDILEHLYNLNLQVRSMQRHLSKYDIDDVFEIVIPVDLVNTPEIGPVRYNLFDDFPKLTSEIVAQSNAWYMRWINEDFISDHMDLSFTCFSVNSEDTVYNKSLEEYETFHPMQRGGPLLAVILLKKIYNASEPHLDHMKLKVKQLKINKLKHEDVDHAVSLVDAAYRMFVSSSTPSTPRVPPDWSKDLLAVFQTTSVSDFNKVFKDETTEVLRVSDKTGNPPVWPTHQSIINLATRNYHRLKATGEWDVPANRKSKSYLTSIDMAVELAPNTPLAMLQQQNDRMSKIECWNCGRKGHGVNDCPEPRNQAKIDRARQAFRNRRNGPNPSRPPSQNPNRRSNRPPPRYKKQNGMHMVLNRNGVYVLDQHRLALERRAAPPDARARPSPAAPQRQRGPRAPQANVARDLAGSLRSVQDSLRAAL